MRTARVYLLWYYDMNLFNAYLLPINPTKTNVSMFKIFNSFMTEAVIIKKPNHWFSLQINGTGFYMITASVMKELSSFQWNEQISWKHNLKILLVHDLHKLQKVILAKSLSNFAAHITLADAPIATLSKESH